MTISIYLSVTLIGYPWGYTESSARTQSAVDPFHDIFFHYDKETTMFILGFKRQTDERSRGSLSAWCCVVDAMFCGGGGVVVM